MEGVYTIERSVVRFERHANYRYRIELSMDGSHWVDAVDNAETESTEQIRTDHYPPATIGRYLRITYTGLPDGVWASHSEMEVYGAGL